MVVDYPNQRVDILDFPRAPNSDIVNEIYEVLEGKPESFITVPTM